MKRSVPLCADENRALGERHQRIDLRMTNRRHSLAG